VKNQPIDWEKIFEDHLSGKVLISKKCKNLQKIIAWLNSEQKTSWTES
jgi:hypothetical protein